MLDLRTINFTRIINLSFPEFEDRFQKGQRIAPLIIPWSDFMISLEPVAIETRDEIPK